MSIASVQPAHLQTELAAAVRESATLPLLFLTVVTAASVRVSVSSGQLSFAPPALIFLVLALLVVAVLAQSGALDLDALVHARRRPLENLSGAIVLITLYAASAQLLAALTPEGGLLHFVFVVFFALHFWNTLAIAPDAQRARRSLVLALGAALVVKYVVLAALFAPAATLAKRVLMTLLDGVTLGGLDHQPSVPVTGYVVFGALLLYVVGLVLVPSRQRTAWVPGRSSSRGFLTQVPDEGPGEGSREEPPSGTPV